MKKTILLLLIILPFNLFAQKQTTVSGRVIDATTGEDLPFVNVIFEGKKIGTSTDMKGKFHIETLWASNKLQISFIGYKSQELDVAIGTKNDYDEIRLVPESVEVSEIIVKPKRVRYRKKDNPAVELMRKVIDNKKQNRIEARDYYQYDSYEKLELAINNIKPDLKDKKSMRNFQFMFNYVDTSALNGKPYLPIFLKETVSEKYYRKSPQATKEIVKASKMSGFDQYFDHAGISSYLDLLFNYINIYDNDIILLDKRFVSPLSNIATTFYKFYLLDTVEINGAKCIDVTFIPHNPADWGFSGHLYVALDSTYAVKKAKLNVLKKINLNFVDDMSIDQEFSQLDSTLILTKDEVAIDFNIFDMNQGVYGKHTTMYKNYVFDKPRPETDYAGNERKIRLADSDEKNDEYWNLARHEKLNKEEQGIYNMLDTLNNVKQFRNFMNVLVLVASGYVEFNKWDFGPVDAMYSHNKIEGHRFRVGGKTNAHLNPHLFFEGYLAYGTKDQKFKYLGSVTYSFNKKKYHQGEYPMNMLNLSYEYNTKIPGQTLSYSTSDNFMLSFNRGTVDKMTYRKNLKLQYDLEIKNGWGFQTALSRLQQSPAGMLRFENNGVGGVYNQIKDITSSELSLQVRFAPNEQFYQNKRNRIPMTKNEPVITLNHNIGIKNFLGSDYSYQNTQLSLKKRFWLSGFGYIDALARGGIAWGGKTPYLLLFVHNANQTYAYHDYSYNMMNFLEFVSDKYASIDLAYNMQGFLLNRIPLFKKLKWREVVTFKALWGSLSDKNTPANDASLLRFPTDKDGNVTMFELGKKPYMEGSAGIDNIFRVLRVDLVWRMSYRDNPDVSKLGVRFKFHVQF